MLLALNLAKFQGPSLPMLRGPMPSQLQGPTRMNKQPRLIRPLAQSQYQYQGMKTLLQWPVSPTDGVLRTTMVNHKWLLVRNRVSPTKADNQLIWDKVVRVTALVVGVEIDFAWTLDIGLIRDEANVAAPRREPQVESELASLRDDVDAILATPTVELQAAPTVLFDDTVLDALFSGTAEEGPKPAHTKGALSSATVVEVPPVMRDVVSTTDGAVGVTERSTKGAMMVDVGTTEGDPSMVLAGSRKSDPPTC
uniref:Integrase core domain containing protein n=1 Tax=Solanum tuberosum TaxID=4113 RepID=M1DX65_SOLTU